MAAKNTDRIARGTKRAINQHLSANGLGTLGEGIATIGDAKARLTALGVPAKTITVLVNSYAHKGGKVEAPAKTTTKRNTKRNTKAKKPAGKVAFVKADGTTVYGTKAQVEHWAKFREQAQARAGKGVTVQAEESTTLELTPELLAILTPKMRKLLGL